MRICSLLPSATETVASLGLVSSIVAVSEECDWPPEVRTLPVVTASRVDTTRLSSFEIDQAVRDAVGDGRPLYAIDRELLEALEPDLILTQNLCAVCAVSADTVGELCSTEAEVVALDAHTLAEIEERILSLADLLGVPAQGHAVVEEMAAKIAAVGERVAAAPRPPVFLAEWLDPPYAAGHWIPEMVALAAGAKCWDEPARPRTPPRGRPCSSSGPSSSSSRRAASTTRVPPVRPFFRSWVAASWPSTRTPTTRARRPGSPTASNNSPSSSIRNSSPIRDFLISIWLQPSTSADNVLSNQR